MAMGRHVDRLRAQQCRLGVGAAEMLPDAAASAWCRRASVSPHEKRRAAPSPDYDPPMPDVLVIGDTYRSPELRHEVPLGVPDPFVYLEHDGGRHVYVGSMEVDRIRGLGLDLVVHPLEEIGIDELYAQGLDWHELRLAWVTRACLHAGIRSAVVPHTFPAGHLDRIRAEGVELVVDQSEFVRRRRVKNAQELAGVRRAQRAAEAGFAAGVELLRAAEEQGGKLLLDGRELTVERVKAARVKVDQARYALWLQAYAIDATFIKVKGGSE